MEVIQAEVNFQAFVREQWEPLPAPVVDSASTNHACLLCRAVFFFNFHAWSAHAAKVHKYRSRARRLAQGLRCQACAMSFSVLAEYRRHFAGVANLLPGYRGGFLGVV